MGCTWRIWLGAGLEAIGFLCVVGELARVQWRVFGTPKFVLWLATLWQGVVRKLLRRPPRVVYGSGASVLGRATLSGEGHVWAAMGPDVGDRVAALEKNVTTLYEQLGKRTAKLDQRVRQLADDLQSTRSAVEERESAREEERQSFVRASQRLQVAATLFFLAGLFVSVWGGLTTC